MRQAARTDDNQAEIIRQLRKVGATVHSTHAVGGGFPDLAVGLSGLSYLFEVKNPKHPPSRRQLNAKQLEWHKLWQGQASVIETPEDALRALGLI